MSRLPTHQEHIDQQANQDIYQLINNFAISRPYIPFTLLKTNKDFKTLSVNVKIELGIIIYLRVLDNISFTAKRIWELKKEALDVARIVFNDAKKLFRNDKNSITRLHTSFLRVMFSNYDTELFLYHFKTIPFSYISPALIIVAKNFYKAKSNQPKSNSLPNEDSLLETLNQYITYLEEKYPKEPHASAGNDAASTTQARSEDLESSRTSATSGNRGRFFYNPYNPTRIVHEYFPSKTQPF